MRIVTTHSHLNGLEYLLVHKPELWREITQTIERLDVHKDDAVQISGEFAKLLSPHDRVGIDVKVKAVEASDATFEAIARHYLQYVHDEIDVGIEILPMKSLQSQMSSGPGYYEGELYNVIRNGRGVPAVPLVMIGVAP